jgi:hypothetical protein
VSLFRTMFNSLEVTRLSRYATCFWDTAWKKDIDERKNWRPSHIRYNVVTARSKVGHVYNGRSIAVAKRLPRTLSNTYIGPRCHQTI